MRNLIRKIAVRLGFYSWYHISGAYSTSAGASTISMNCRVTPWIHVDNYAEIVAYVKSKAQGDPENVTITSIYRLGI